MVKEPIAITTDGGGFTIATPKRYMWKPQEDITAYELALAMPLFAFCCDIEQMVKDLPETVRRHLEEVRPD